MRAEGSFRTRHSNFSGFPSRHIELPVFLWRPVSSWSFLSWRPDCIYTPCQQEYLTRSRVPWSPWSNNIKVNVRVAEPAIRVCLILQAIRIFPPRSLWYVYFEDFRNRRTWIWFYEASSGFRKRGREESVTSRCMRSKFKPGNYFCSRSIVFKIPLVSSNKRTDIVVFLQCSSKKSRPVAIQDERSIPVNVQYF